MMKSAVKRFFRHSVLAGLVLTGSASLAHAQGTSYEQLQTFSGILNQIRLNYVDSVTYTQLVRSAIDGVLASLDPHSYFLPREQGMRSMAYEAGELAGTGLIVSEVEGLPTIQAVLPESPAAKAGISAGDRLIRVNDTVVVGMTSQSLQGRLIGERGKRVRLALQRGQRWEPDSLRVTVKFDYLEPHAVTNVRMVNQITGYLRLQQFYLKAPEEVEDALKKLRSAGATRVIFDLRGNPGGIVRSAVDIASVFFPKGTTVFSTEGRRKSASQQFTTENDGRYRDLPLIVLIDEGSASASEALTGSLQDHDRALIMGRRSFGKALMQRAFEVPPAGDLVWLTVGHVLTPSGRFIQRRYQGLNATQYYANAGEGGAEQDTTAVFHTDAGRLVRGGGGIVPDIALPGRTPLPVWFSVAADSGFTDAIADSLAGTLPADDAGKQRFMGAVASWQTALVAPFLDRVRQRLHVAADPDSSLRARLGRILASRTVEVRWGSDAQEQFQLSVDADVQAALPYFARMDELLKHP
ncbi:MAG: S41 family peptidase [Gemmatimonadota bacterium]